MGMISFNGEFPFQYHFQLYIVYCILQGFDELEFQKHVVRFKHGKGMGIKSPFIPCTLTHNCVGGNVYQGWQHGRIV